MLTGILVELSRERTSIRSHAKEILSPFDFENPSMAKSALSNEYQQLMSDLTDNKMYQLAYSSFLRNPQYNIRDNGGRKILILVTSTQRQLKVLEGSRL